MKWLLVAIIVATTTGKDVLKAIGMKAHGEIHEFRPGALGRVPAGAGAESQYHRCRSSARRLLLHLPGAGVDRRLELRGSGHRRQLRVRNHPGEVRPEGAGHLGALDRRGSGSLRGRAAVAVSYLWAAPAIAAGAYYLIALAAAIARLRYRDPVARSTPPVSILKPVHGHDPRFYEAIRSHAIPDYPEYEILFGVKDPGDKALADIRRLQAEFPEPEHPPGARPRAKRPTARWRS